MKMKNQPSLGIVADWLVNYAGAEAVIADFIRCFPDADLYSVVDFLDDISRERFNNKTAKTTFIQNLPGAKKHYQKYLPIMPLAIEQLDVSKHDIILSSSHAVSKGVLTGPDQLHISYVHSPIRYAWDLQHQYLTESGFDKGIKSIIVRYLLHKIRMWDYRTANGVDFFIANSKFISRRIKKVYGRDSDVIYPPVSIDRFSLCENKEEFYLTASRLVPYKRVDLIVDAFKNMPDKKLVVIGSGSEIDKIKSKASKNIEILGYQSNEVLLDYMQRAKAFVFAAEEDFGITPVEAMACGTPVIAFGKGGALETIVSESEAKPTGLFFSEQSPSSICSAVKNFEIKQHLFTPENCRERSQFFSETRFRDELSNYILKRWEDFQHNKC